MGKLYYLCNYDDYLNHRNLSTQPSGVSKINYIRRALKAAGIKFELLSTAECKQDRWCVNMPQRKHIDNQEDDYYMLSIGRPNFVLKILSRLLLYVQIAYFLLFKVRPDDKVLVYHSLNVAYLIYMMRRVLKRRIYFEVEEIYNAVYKHGDAKIRREISYLKKAEGYLFVNDIMQNKCDIEGGAIVCYGSYDTIDYRPEILDNKIHVVYAGLIGEEGSDAYLAVDIAYYLPCNYHVHVLGYGVERNIERLNTYIDGNKDKLSCGVTYEGCLYGDEYDDFLSRCQVGLCTRRLDNELSDYTFPSKILVYLGHNVIPVCTPLDCVRLSRIGNHVYFSDDVSAESIAKTILSIKGEKVDGSEVMGELHEEFVGKLKAMFV